MHTIFHSSLTLANDAGIMMNLTRWREVLTASTSSYIVFRSSAVNLVYPKSSPQSLREVTRSCNGPYCWTQCKLICRPVQQVHQHTNKNSFTCLATVCPPQLYSEEVRRFVSFVRVLLAQECAEIETGWGEEQLIL